MFFFFRIQNFLTLEGPCITFRGLSIGGKLQSVMFTYTVDSFDSVQLSAEALKKLLQRLALINKEAWLERCFVTLIWMLTTSSSDVQGGLDILNDTIGKFGDYWSKPLSAAASHASLIVSLQSKNQPLRQLY